MKLFRLDNQIINLEAISSVEYHPATAESDTQCILAFQGNPQTMTMTGANAAQCWGLIRHYSMNITPLPEQETA